MAVAVVAVEEQIKAVEEELLKTKYNKATSGHIGKLKAKLSRLRLEAEKRASSGGGGGVSYAVAKSGHATVALVGLPSVGKSTLLNALAGTKSEVAAYAFTTLTVVPGLVRHRGADIQVLDLPGLIGGASGGKGRGREVLSVVRNSNLVLLTLEVFHPEAIDILVTELGAAAVRINKRPPDVKITKKDRGGIKIMSTVKLTKVDEDLLAEILREFHISNADVVVRQNITAEDFIDVVTGNRVYLPGLIVLTKTDMVTPEETEAVLEDLRTKGWSAVPMAAERGLGVEPMKDAMYGALDFIRIYLKPQGKDADMKDPLVMRRGTTVADVCRTLHRDFEDKFRYAIITGPSGKFAGQTVGLEHQLLDTDVLTIVVRR